MTRGTRLGDNMKMIKRDLDKEFVMPFKSNRKVALSREEKGRGQYQAVSPLELPVDATRRSLARRSGLSHFF